MAQSFAKFYTELHGVFLKGIVLRELHRGILLERVSGFKFQVSSFRFVAQSLLRQFTIARVAKFYTEMHGFFWKRIMLKRATQRSYTLMGTWMTQIYGLILIYF